MSTAREEMLDRIRAGLADVPPEETPEDVAVERGYVRSWELPREELLELFAERVAEYRATVRRVPEAGLPAAVASACAARGVRRLVVPPDLPSAWVTEGIEVLRDEGLTVEELDGSDGVLTACALGIAQTGTLVLDGGLGQGRRIASLLPDYHLCVVRAEQVVGTAPEAIALLEDGVRRERRPLTFISGPSATSDIELNRVEGVHGPRTLEVLLVV